MSTGLRQRLSCSFDLNSSCDTPKAQWFSTVCKTTINTCFSKEASSHLPYLPLHVPLAAEVGTLQSPGWRAVLSGWQHCLTVCAGQHHPYHQRPYCGVAALSEPAWLLSVLDYWDQRLLLPPRPSAAPRREGLADLYWSSFLLPNARPAHTRARSCLLSHPLAASPTIFTIVYLLVWLFKDFFFLTW